MDGNVFMTKKEISRADIFMQISQKQISQTEAAEVLGISLRHLQRLYSVYKVKGISSLLSKQRGKSSNHQLSTIVKARAQEIVTCELYKGFRPTLMCEKLKELHGIDISRETVRQMMIEVGVWQANKKKSPVIHQQRVRRARFGELVQIDGSPHAWFEERGEPCVLIVYIDDATGQTYGKFCEAETTKIYMAVTWEYIITHGRPLAFYSDKLGVFRINKPGCTREDNMTQFGRALKELDIELIYANSPQAKGRVERMILTLQDRLVKELRLAGASTIEEANEFLKKYWDKFNKKLEKTPTEKGDAHRKMLPEHDLESIFSNKELRTISKNLEVQYKNVIYQICVERPGKTLCGANVTMIEKLNGEVSIEYKGKLLPYKVYGKQNCSGIEMNTKELDRFLREKKSKKPRENHPWKNQGAKISVN